MGIPYGQHPEQLASRGGAALFGLI